MLRTMTLVYAQALRVAYRRKFWYKISNTPIAAMGLYAQEIVTLYTLILVFRNHSILADREHILYKSLTFENVKTLALTFYRILVF